MSGRHGASLLVLAGFLSGCISSGQVETLAAQRWVGRPAEQFFANHGPPQATVPMATGGERMTWQGGGLPYAGVFRVQCVIEIETAPDRSIKAVRIVRDDLGINRTSRCAELLP